jgi:hypothetical protein
MARKRVASSDARSATGVKNELATSGEVAPRPCLGGAGRGDDPPARQFVQDREAS